MTESRDLEDLARLHAHAGSSTGTARFIAGVLTPANLVATLLAVISLRYSTSVGAALGWAALTILLMVGAPYLILFRWMRTGRVADRQVVRRSQRPLLLAAAGGCVAVALATLYAAGAPHRLLALVVAMLGGLAAMGLVSTRWKASMHLAVASGACAVVAFEYPQLAPSLFLVLPVLGWARWSDGRHSLAQVIGGAVIGGLVSATLYGCFR